MPLRDLTSLAFGKLDPQRLLGTRAIPLEGEEVKRLQGGIPQVVQVEHC